MRKVASQKGVEYYDLPLGTPITADVLEKARKKNKGKPPPKGATRQARATSPAVVSKAPKTAPPKGAPAAPQLGPTPAAQRDVKGKAKIKAKPQLGGTGTAKFSIGGKEFDAPEGSRVFYMGEPDVGLMVAPDGSVHVYNQHGEVEISSRTEAKVKAEMAEKADQLKEFDLKGSGSGKVASSTNEKGSANGKDTAGGDPDPGGSGVVPEVRDSEGRDSGTGEADSGALDGRTDSGSGGDGLVIDGTPVKTKTVFKNGTARNEAIKAAGGSTPVMYELDSEAEAPRFHAAMEKMKENNKFSSSVYVYDEADYAKMRLFMAEDGKSGLAIKDGDELVSAWSDPTSKNKKVARHLVATGIEQGGRRADAFDTVLPGIYALEGLRVKARLKWDDKEAPPDWDKETYAAFNGGEPDVTFLAYDESKVDQPYVPGEGKQVSTYDEGLAAVGPNAPKTNSAEAAGFKRNPKSLGESSMRAPDPKEIKALQVSPYTSPHVNDKGEFTAERKKIHEQIITDFLDGLEEQENPVQYMNGGGPASGKGSMTKGRNAELTRYPSSRGVDERTGDIEPMEGTPGALLIDPDAIKMQLPEVKLALERIHAGDYEDEDKGWAGHSHEESSQLAKRLHAAALDRGYNVIYDGTGNSTADSVRKKVAAAREAGYKVEANYLFLQPTEGISRAKSRADRSHRIVPEEQIRGTYAALPEIFDQLKADGTFDKVNLFDNNRDGEPARLVGSGNGKNFDITDQDAYDAYMASGASAWEGYEPPAELAAKLEKLKTTDSSKKAKAGGVTKVS